MLSFEVSRPWCGGTRINAGHLAREGRGYVSLKTPLKVDVEIRPDPTTPRRRAQDGAHRGALTKFKSLPC